MSKESPGTMVKVFSGWIPVAVLLVLSACKGQGAVDEGGGASGSSGVEGLWQTEGYGHVLEIGSEQGRWREVTAISCLPSFDMTVVPSEVNDAEVQLEVAESEMRIDVQPGAGPEEKWLRLAGLASRRRLMRVEQLPEVCSSETGSDPLSVFDVFWHTYREHYPFFEMKGIDWQEVREKERARISAETTSEELFEILKGMMAPLEDAHTFLSAPDLDTRFGGSRPDPNPLDEAARERAWQIVQDNYLTEQAAELCNERLVVGRLVDSVRYLRLHSFSGYGIDFADGMVCLEGVLDRLLEDPAEIAGLILDVRINGGGADPYGLAIASRLTPEPYLAYTKETRNDPDDPSSWTRGQPAMVVPGTRLRFEGPVVLLTGQRSVSAAETFTMALMGRRPEVTRIGQNTQGVFSDVMSRSLPNGWRFGLPNERFLTVDGQSFDGPGIAPHIEVPLFSPQDLETGVDSAIERAMVVLREGSEASL